MILIWRTVVSLPLPNRSATERTMIVKLWRHIRTDFKVKHHIWEIVIRCQQFPSLHKHRGCFASRFRQTSPRCVLIPVLRQNGSLLLGYICPASFVTGVWVICHTPCPVEAKISRCVDSECLISTELWRFPLCIENVLQLLKMNKLLD